MATKTQTVDNSVTTGTTESTGRHPVLTAMWAVRSLVGLLRSKLPDTKNLVPNVLTFIELGNKATKVDWVAVQKHLDAIRTAIGSDKVADRVIRIGLGKEARDLSSIGAIVDDVMAATSELEKMPNIGGFQFGATDGKIYASMSGRTLVNMIRNPNSAADFVLLA